MKNTFRIVLYVTVDDGQPVPMDEMEDVVGESVQSGAAFALPLTLHLTEDSVGVSLVDCVKVKR